MKNSVLLIFSIFKNIENFEKNKNDCDLTELKSEFWFKRSPNYFKIFYKKIYNDIENSFYTIDDLMIFLLCNLLLEKKINIKNINYETITKNKKCLTKNQLIYDKKFILKLMEKLNVDLHFLLKHTNGGCILYDQLIKKEKISIMFILYLTNHIKINNTHQQIIINKIKTLITKRKVANG